MLGDMIQEYQKENKELKQRLLDLQQSMHCNEQALVNQGQKLLALKRRANSIAEARPQEPPTKRHLKLSPLN
jgi:cell division septum initiation protein DivIVA